MRESLLEHLVAPAIDHTSDAPPLRLEVFQADHDHVLEGVLIADDGRWWWIDAGIPRLLPRSLYDNPDLADRHAARLRRLGLELLPPVAGRTDRVRARLQRQTMDRFGDEWRRYRQWGYEPEPPDEEDWTGGLWAHTVSSFRNKTFLGQCLDGALCLDAGCGNGRFTAAALDQGAREVIAIDLGWGVEAAFDHLRNHPRVHIVQGSLFELPIRSVDVAFSIGVLMHTGDAGAAFARIAAVIPPGGHFSVRLYHRGNWAYESIDRTIRALTTRLPRRGQLSVAEGLARLGRAICRIDQQRPGFRSRCYQLLHHWPTLHHNVDWWGAPVASHHTMPEVASWARRSGLDIVRCDPEAGRTTYPFWQWPESVTALFRRPAPILRTIQMKHPQETSHEPVSLATI